MWRILIRANRTGGRTRNLTKRGRLLKLEMAGISKSLKSDTEWEEDQELKDNWGETRRNWGKFVAQRNSGVTQIFLGKEISDGNTGNLAIEEGGLRRDEGYWVLTLSLQR